MTVAMSAVSAIPTLRDTINLANLVAASNDTGDRALEFSAAAFEFHLIESDPEPARPDLLGIAAIIEVDIPEANIVGLCPNGASTCANGASLHLPQFTPTIIMIAITVMALGFVSVRPVSAVPDVQIQTAIIGLDRDGATDIFARFAMVGERRRGEEQRRRKGKRGCSRFHDAFHHGCRNTQTKSPEPERCIRLAFIYLNRCPFLAIMS